MKVFDKAICMACGKETNQDVCECGERDFIFGDNINYSTDNGVSCQCGNTKFKMISHINMNPIYNKTYACECGNTFGIQTYYISPYI